MDQMEVSLIELGADKLEAEQITATLNRIMSKAMMKDPARAARSIGTIAAILNQTVYLIQGQQSWDAERALQETLDDHED